MFKRMVSILGLVALLTSLVPFAHAQDSDWTISGNDQYSAVSGYVGIGTTAPLTQLDVSSSTSALRLRAGSAATNFIKNQILFSYSGTPFYSHAIKSRHSSFTDDNALDFFLWDYANDDKTDDGSLHVMTLSADNDGAVGVGTTTPNYSLDVNGSAGFRSDVTFEEIATDDNADVVFSQTNYGDGRIHYLNGEMYFMVNGSEYLHIDSSGNVGVGTNSPSYTLHVDGAIGAGSNVTFEEIATDDNADIVFPQTSYGEGRIHYINGEMYFMVNGSEHLHIDSSGNLGVGTTDPNATLDVDGDLKFGDHFVVVHPDFASDHGDDGEEGSIAWHVSNMEDTGGIIYLQPGSFNVESQAIPLTDGLKIIGSGPSTILEANSSLTDDVINNESISLGDPGVREVTLSDFKIVGNDYNSTSGGKSDSSDCIDIGGGDLGTANQSENVTIKNLIIETCGATGINLKHTDGATIQNVTIHDAGNNAYEHGMYITEVTRLHIDSATITSGDGHGINFDEVSFGNINNVTISGVGEQAIRIGDASTNLNFTNLTAENSDEEGVRILGSSQYITFSSCHILENGQSSSGDAEQSGINIESGQYVTISSCVIRDNVTDGIHITGGDWVSMTGNVIVDNGDDGIDLNGSGSYPLFVGNINEDNGGSDTEQADADGNGVGDNFDDSGATGVKANNI